MLLSGLGKLQACENKETVGGAAEKAKSKDSKEEELLYKGGVGDGLLWGRRGVATRPQRRIICQLGRC